jgi:hypothetical protein
MPIAQKAPKGPRPLGDSRGRTRAARMVLRRPRQTSPATNWRWLTTPPATATTGLFRTARYAARLGRPPAIANENEQTFRPWYPQFRPNSPSPWNWRQVPAPPVWRSPIEEKTNRGRAASFGQQFSTFVNIY